ncbi:Ldh family oxidoreductase [bacterium]|nr:Ldh family oxidoreductase [bacterium]
MPEIRKTIEELTELVATVLVSHNASEDNARQVAIALIAAEVEGQKGHGVSRVASYSAQAKSGKVNGFAIPEVIKVADAAIRVDAKHGFAFPAFSAAIETLTDLASNKGIAAAVITQSHHCGMLGYHAEKLAQKGLIALVFSNSPKAIAPWGGNQAVFGTNPIAFAAPRANSEPLVIDLSLSKVARGKVKMAYENNQSIPEGWALDKDGKTTTDAAAALSGTMVPMGEGKGSALVLMVEILAAALSASHFGFEASSFFTADGPAPDIGQLMIAISPGPLSANLYFNRIEALIAAILGQEGTRLPGSARAEKWEEARANGIKIGDQLFSNLLKLRNNPL